MGVEKGCAVTILCHLGRMTDPLKPKAGAAPEQKPSPPAEDLTVARKPATTSKPLAKEIGGPPGPEPTRYGDWQYKGRCTDF